jgi:hypothetical protein
MTVKLSVQGQSSELASVTLAYLNIRRTHWNLEGNTSLEFTVYDFSSHLVCIVPVHHIVRHRSVCV